MRPVVIELGVPGQPVAGPPARSWPVRRHLRAAGAALVVLLVLATGGAAPPGPPSLVEVAALPSRLTRLQALTGDQFYAIEEQSDGSGWALTARDLSRGRLRWISPLDADLGVGPPGQRVDLSVMAMGDVLVVSGIGWHTGFDAATGREMWTIASRIHPVRWGLAYTFSKILPAGAEVPAEVDPGQGGAGLADGGIISVFDLRSGGELWTSPVLRDSRFIESAADPSLVVLTMDGALEVWDARTGTARLSRPAEADRSWLGVTVVSGLVLVSDPSPAVTAYAADTLEFRWRAELPDLGRGYSSCGGWLCRHGRNEAAVVDADTGRHHGRVTGIAALVTRGGHVLAIDAGDATRTVELPSGRTLMDLAGWRTVGPLYDESAPVLVRVDPDQLVSWFAVLEPEATELRVLGSVPYRVDQCRASASHVACQVGLDDLRIWRFR